MDSENSAQFPHDADSLEEQFGKILANLPPMPVDDSTKTKTLYDIVKSDGEASVFAAYLDQHPDLSSKLQDTSEYTLFLPVDAAWAAKDDPASVAPENIQDVLSQHVSPHYVTMEGLLHMPNVPSILLPPAANGPQIIRSRVSSAGWRLNQAALITKGNILASNGIIHKIDHVLEPPPATLALLKAKGLTRLANALKIAGVEEEFFSGSIKGRTLFAPSDAAFEQLGPETLHFLFESEEGKPYLKALLRLHFIPNLTFFTNFIWPKNNTGARQTSADVSRRIKGSQTQQVPSALASVATVASVPPEASTIAVGIARFCGLISLVINGNAKVVGQDTAAADGVVQIIDKVLLPQGSEVAHVGEVTFEEFKKAFAAFAA